ncbi:hypothetical protein R3W88_020688 [Solanum pinnatisectum]|uniref:Uncharacterized protein n=1 Tax=Solanum pinnatisectum TaxID=50273 RepID=A0AAV9KNN7_9SOLN|nr:hypothetical protein R3W88_020688 [Solanum pinnatisectum]
MIIVMGVLSKELNCVEIECGSSNPKYGDSKEILRIFQGGKLEIVCHCHDGCKKGRRTRFLKYHIDTFHRPIRGGIIHRDEFICCTKCNKQHRFFRRTKEECKYYHDAIAMKDWKCSDMPQKAKCNGCVRCVCFSCSMCTFENCKCRACVDFFKIKYLFVASSQGYL